MSSVNQQLNKFEALLQHPPAGWQELAIEKRAFRRSRQIRSPLKLLRLMFVYLTPDNSLRSIAAALVSRRIWMTDQAVFNRLHNCRDWLESLLNLMLSQHLAAQMSNIGKRLPHRGLKIVDATVLNCPGAKGDRLSSALKLISAVRAVGVRINDLQFNFFSPEFIGNRAEMQS